MSHSQPMQDDTLQSLNLPRHQWLLWIGLIVGCLLLLIAPLSKPIWTDELVSIQRAHNPFWTIITGRADDTQPPLHFALLHLCLAWFGENLFVFRLVSALPSVVALWYVYLIGRRIGPQVALLAVWLSALSPALVLFDRMARYHGLLTMLATMSVYYGLRLLDKETRRDLASYVAATFLMLMTSYLSLFVLPAQAAVVLARWRRGLPVRPLIWGMALTVGIFLPWLVHGLLFASPHYASPVESPAMSLGVNGFILRAGLPIYAYFLGETVQFWNWPVVIVGVVGGAAAFLLGLRQFRSRPELMLPLTCLLVIFLSALLTSGKLGTYQTVGSMAKRVGFALPLFYVTLSAGICALRRLPIRGSLIALLLGVQLYSLNNYWSDQQFLNPAYIARWDEAIAQMQRVHLASDTQIFSPEPALDYYLNQLSPPVQHSLTVSPDEVFHALSRSRSRYVWVVGRDRGDRNAVSQTDDLDAALSSRYRQVGQYGIMPRSLPERQWMQRTLKRPLDPYYIWMRLYDTSVRSQNKPQTSGPGRAKSAGDGQGR